MFFRHRGIPQDHAHVGIQSVLSCGNWRIYRVRECITFPRGLSYPSAVDFAPPAITRRIYRIQCTDIGSFARPSIILGWRLVTSHPADADEKHSRYVNEKIYKIAEHTLVKIQRRAYIRAIQNLSRMAVINIHLFEQLLYLN